MVGEAQWDLFRTFDAVVRRGSFTAAAKALGMSQSTVSRHVAELEAEAGTPLLLRSGPLALTERGAALRDAVGPMILAATAARAALESTSELHGQVTLATVGEIVRWVLAHRLADLYRAHPSLRLKLLADNRLHSLASGEADIALRMARPARGELIARRLATESFGLFAASTLPLDRTTPWLGLTGSLATIGEQRHVESAFAARRPRLLVEDIDSLGVAVQAGLGVAVLPRLFAARLADLVEVRPSRVGARDLGPIPSRSMWLVVHRAKRDLPEVRAVIRWIDGIFAGGKAPR